MRGLRLFHDSDTWSSHRSPYYIGVLPAFLTLELRTGEPTINNALRTHLENDWHTNSIRLAASGENLERSPETLPNAIFTTQSPTKLNFFTPSLRKHNSLCLSLPSYFLSLVLPPSYTHFTTSWRGNLFTNYHKIINAYPNQSVGLEFPQLHTNAGAEKRRRFSVQWLDRAAWHAS